MASWSLALLVASVLVALTAAESRCDTVADFGECLGDDGNFCPKDIACSCHSSKPFCSCPYYKGPNIDYWYMGEKCDQLWSTRDLLLVAICPAIALAFVVGVTAQLIHFCKSRPKKPRNKDQNARVATQSHQNQAYVPESSINPGFVQQPLVNAKPHALNMPAGQNTAGWQNSQATAYNYPGPQNERPSSPRPVSPVAKPSYLPYYPSQAQEYNGYPEDDYPNRRLDRSESHHFKPRSTVPSIPKPDYRAQQPAQPNPNAQWADRSFMMGRPQTRNSYAYQ